MNERGLIWLDKRSGDDATVLLAGAMSLIIVLVTLYRNRRVLWEYVKDAVVRCVAGAYVVVVNVAAYSALMLAIGSLNAPPSRRGLGLLMALIIAAAVIVSLKVYSHFTNYYDYMAIFGLRKFMPEDRER